MRSTIKMWLVSFTIATLQSHNKIWRGHSKKREHSYMWHWKKLKGGCSLVLYNLLNNPTNTCYNRSANYWVYINEKFIKNSRLNSSQYIELWGRYEVTLWGWLSQSISDLTWPGSRWLHDSWESWHHSMWFSPSCHTGK